MTQEFQTVYASARGLDVRLEAADISGSDGTVYPHHRLVIAQGREGAVVIARRDASVLFVRSDRAAAGRRLWELPRGTGEDKDQAEPEPAIATALRELREETGLQARNPRLLARYLVDSSLYPQTVGVVVCDVDPDASRDVPDGEVEDEKWVPISEIPAIVRDGVLQDAHTLSALAVWAAEEER